MRIPSWSLPKNHQTRARTAIQNKCRHWMLITPDQRRQQSGKACCQLSMILCRMHLLSHQDQNVVARRRGHRIWDDYRAIRHSRRVHRERDEESIKGDDIRRPSELWECNVLPCMDLMNSTRKTKWCEITTTQRGAIVGRHMIGATFIPSHTASSPWHAIAWRAAILTWPSNKPSRLTVISETRRSMPSTTPR